MEKDQKKLGNTKEGQIAFFQKVLKVSLYLLVFLLPLWFLPFTQDILNYQKQVLLMVLAIVALLSWLLKTVRQEELEIRFSAINIAVLAVLLVSGISTITSLWRYGSFFGWAANVTDSFLTLLLFAIVYFLISNTVKDIKEFFHLFFVFIISFVIAGIYALLQLYGVFILPFSFAKLATFNTMGSANSVAVLAGILLPFIFASALVLKKKFTIWLWIFAAFLLSLLLLINFFNAWLALAVGAVVLLIFGIINAKNVHALGSISLPVALLIISLFFLFFKISIPLAPYLPIEIYPDAKAEITIVKNVLQNHWAFGTGPATFIFDYAKYRPVSINATPFWSTKFTTGFSEILNWFIAKGIFGGIAFVALLIVALVVSLKNIFKSKNDPVVWMVNVGMFASLLSLVVIEAIYFTNFTALFFFWILLAGVAVATSKERKKIATVSNSAISIAWSAAALVILLLSVGLLFIEGQNYAAEVKYYQGLKISSNQKIQTIIDKVLSAANLNPAVDTYWQDLAKLYLSQGNEVFSETNLSKEQQQQKSKDAVNNATYSANRAVEVNPANAENWNIRGFVYGNLIGVLGADSLAVESYKKAIELAPSSPFSFTELARVYLNQSKTLTGQQAQEDALNSALENLNKAIALKADYASAYYLRAIVYDRQGKSSEAISELEKAVMVAPNDVDLIFQVGMIYYQQGQYTKAQIKFEKVKALNPDYSNGRYMLGLVYDKEGQAKKAITEFQKVLELNPGNAQVKQILININSGKPALSGIESSSLQ